MDIHTHLNSKPVRVVLIYRPPQSNKNDFLTELSEFLSENIASKNELVLLGDFNFHLEDDKSPHTRELCNLLTAFGLESSITQPTHKAGHSLDAVIHMKNSAFTFNHRIVDLDISDHFLIEISLDVSKPVPPKKSIVKRNLKNIDLDKLKNDISNALEIPADSSIDTAVQIYNENLRGVIDSHAPLVAKHVKIRRNTKWFNDQIRSAKIVRRRLERKMNKSGLVSDRKAFVNQCRYVNFLVKTAKTEYLKKTVCESKHDVKQLFRVTKSILTLQPDTVLPDIPDRSVMASSFSEYFINKIVKINTDIESEKGKAAVLEIKDIIRSDNITLDAFREATEKEIETAIISSSASTSDLDPLPTVLIKNCKGILVKPLTEIVNISLRSGVVSCNLKEAVIKPLIKKANLDANNFKNYRPVSNIAFVSKLIEKVVANRINEHVDTHGLSEKFQSAYRKYHSTESALLRVQNDINMALQNRKLCALFLLDLSSAFDTINHARRLSRLSYRFGISGTALAWIKSYLSERTQRVYVDGHYSSKAPLQTGVPQGSVLGPILFTMYMAPVGDILREHGISHHFYADDTQIYVFLTLKTRNAHVIV